MHRQGLQIRTYTIALKLLTSIVYLFGNDRLLKPILVSKSGMHLNLLLRGL